MKWNAEVEKLKELCSEGRTLKEIGRIYGVSRQRLYQVLTKYGIETPQKKKKNFLKDKEPKYYWLNRMLSSKGLPKLDRLSLVENLNIPDYCPILKIKLNYDGMDCYRTRGDDSPSIDRIDPTKGYTKDNIHIISWRANRIKNDGTPEEHRKIADYIESLSQ